MLVLQAVEERGAVVPGDIQNSGVGRESIEHGAVRPRVVSDKAG